MTQQLKILEAAYKWNVKPSVEHQQKLALEINMTPRDVQVCLRFFCIVSSVDIHFM